MLRYVFNLIYLLLIVCVSPLLFYRRWTQGKYREGWSQKLWGNVPVRETDAPCLWFHAVSVGEVLQLEPIVASWKKSHPNWDIVISTTTQTGMQVARDKYSNCSLCYCPLDFTWAVRNAFERIRPSGFVLVELELWPNLISQAHRQKIPTAIINGRLSEKSFQGYSRIRRLIQPLLEPFDCIAVQNKSYQQRFEDLGAKPKSVYNVGSMKFDRLKTDRNEAPVCELRNSFGLKDKKEFSNNVLPLTKGELVGIEKSNHSLVLMAGSTHAPEEQMIINAWMNLRKIFPNLRLILAPRHAERFDEVAKLVKQRGCQLIRRSEILSDKNKEHDQRYSVLLLDTLGELSACWGLADIAYVGGSLTNRGGQNMMEPAGFGSAVMFGPNTWNFADVVRDLTNQNACLVIEDQQTFEQTVSNLFENSQLRHQTGKAATDYVLSKRGATSKTIKLLEQMLALGEDKISSIAA